MREHKNQRELKINTPKNNWIKKYNKNIKMAIICEVPNYITWQEAEKQWIAFFKWCGIKLLNITDGGEGTNKEHITDEHRNKLKQARIGRKPSLGMHHTDEAKKKISMANSKENHWLFNKSMDNEIRTKISQAKIGKYKGINNPAAKINFNMAQQIRSEYSTKQYTYTMLAHKYNVGQATIGRVIREEIWNDDKI